MVVLGIWLGFLVWVIGCCALLGYQAAGEARPVLPETSGAQATQIAIRAGLPSWIFWGIALPWLAAVVVTLVFGAWILQDDDLGAERDDRSVGS